MAAGARPSILAVWGALVVGGIDNVLRPMFVGNRLQLHTVPAFISMVGGLVLFGAPGFILGPLAVTVTILLVEIWRERRRARPSIRHVGNGGLRAGARGHRDQMIGYRILDGLRRGIDWTAE